MIFNIQSFFSYVKTYFALYQRNFCIKLMYDVLVVIPTFNEA